MVSASGFVRLAKASSRFLAFSALASWFGFIGLFCHYDAVRPTVPLRNEGKVYASNNHGHVVYLSEQDQHQLNLLQGAAFWLFMVAVVLDYVHRERLTPSQIHGYVLAACCWIGSPASWLASLRQLRQDKADSENKSDARRKLKDYKGKGNRISFRTLKSLSECQKIVRSAGYSAFGLVLESFDGHNFSLSVRRSYRNSFAPVCTGKLIPQPSGMTIDVQFGMRASVKVFLTVWFAGIATAGVAILAEIFSGNSPNATIGIVVPPVLLGFGVLLVRFGNRLSQHEETYVLGWLERSFADTTLEQGPNPATSHRRS